MNDSDVSQIVIVNGTRIADLEERLNKVLSDIPASSVIGIDYMYEPDTYGMVAIVRYLVPSE